MLLQVGGEVDIISKLIEHGPLVTVLVWVIWRDMKKIKYLEDENKELHNYIRESEAQNIKWFEQINHNLARIAEKIPQQ